MSSPNPNENPAAGLLLGAVFDFILACCYHPAPMVIGGGYPRDKLIERFETWAAERNMTLAKIDIDQFREACKQGLFS